MTSAMDRSEEQVEEIKDEIVDKVADIYYERNLSDKQAEEIFRAIISEAEDRLRQIKKGDRK